MEDNFFYKVIQKANKAYLVKDSSTLQEEKIYAKDLVGEKGEPGESIKGEDGAEGRGITGAELDKQGFLHLTYSDGKKEKIAKVNGKDGRDGNPGNDGKDGLPGIPGVPGINGKDGIDGRGIEDAIINDKGEFIILFSDGEEKNLGRVVGRDGQTIQTTVSGKVIDTAGLGLTGQMFRSVAVASQPTINAKTYRDTLNIAAGSNVTLTTNAATKTLTIAASGGSGISQITSTGGTITVTNPTGPTVNLEASGGSSVSFQAITSGTNVAAAMVVGTGASIAPTGSGAITATIAPAGALTGTTLASNVVNSSLTSVGTLVNLAVTNPISGSVAGNAGTVTTINGLVAAGTNVSLTGSGTSISPYTISSSGSGTTVNINTLQIDQTPAAGTYGTLAGTVNGSNTVFTVSNTAYVSGSLMVFLNGQELTQGSSNDWTETTPASGTFTFSIAPPTGSIIQAVYIKSATTTGIPPVASVGSINGLSTGSTTLYANSTGSTLIVEDVVLLVTAATAASGGPTAQVGTTSTGFDVYASVAITALTTINKVYHFGGPGISVAIPNGGSLFLDITSGGSGTTLTLKAIVIGWFV